MAELLRQQLLDQRSLAVPPALCAAGVPLDPLLQRRPAGRHVHAAGRRRDPRLLLVDAAQPLIEGALRHSRSAPLHRGLRHTSSTFQRPFHAESRPRPDPFLARCWRLPRPLQRSPPRGSRRRQALHDRLFELFKDSDEASPQAQPAASAVPRRSALRGSARRPYQPTQHYAGEKAAAEHDLAALHAIPRGQLSQTDQLAYDVFEFQTKDTLRGLQPRLLSAHRSAADEPLLRHPHLLSDACERAGRRAVTIRSPIMRTA